ncbi:unnamed protein product, partial [Symbiodinium sp. CCMP2456]
EPADAPPKAAQQQEQPVPVEQPVVEVLKSPSARGSKRPHPATPVKPKPKPAAENNDASEAEGQDEEAPKVMRASDMTKLEREKVRRIVTPKKGSGRLEVPENIFEMWKDAGKGRDNLFRMWAKAGGAVFMESLTILTRTERRKKLEVKGGFYSREDMKTELGYSPSRIEKIVAWATKRSLFRTCEYDDETLEYWVNTRTSGVLSKEDVESMEKQQTYSGEGGDDLSFKPKAACQLKEYMKQVLKAKNSLEGFVDKMRTAVSGDGKDGKEGKNQRLA